MPLLISLVTCNFAGELGSTVGMPDANPGAVAMMQKALTPRFLPARVTAGLSVVDHIDGHTVLRARTVQVMDCNWFGRVLLACWLFGTVVAFVVSGWSDGARAIAPLMLVSVWSTMYWAGRNSEGVRTIGCVVLPFTTRSVDVKQQAVALGAYRSGARGEISLAGETLSYRGPLELAIRRSGDEPAVWYHVSFHMEGAVVEPFPPYIGDYAALRQALGQFARCVGGELKVLPIS